MNTDKNNDLIFPPQFAGAKTTKSSGTLVDNPPNYQDNDNGGDGNMKNNKDFVTHTELELNNERLLRHLDEQFNKLEKKIDSNQAETNLKFESINTKFEKQKVWFYGTAIGIVTATCTIVGFLIKIL